MLSGSCPYKVSIVDVDKLDFIEREYASNAISKDVVIEGLLFFTAGLTPGVNYRMTVETLDHDVIQPELPWGGSLGLVRAVTLTDDKRMGRALSTPSTTRQEVPSESGRGIGPTGEAFDAPKQCVLDYGLVISGISTLPMSSETTSPCLWEVSLALHLL